jgi:hypothetical protein
MAGSRCAPGHPREQLKLLVLWLRLGAAAMSCRRDPGQGSDRIDRSTCARDLNVFVASLASLKAVRPKVEGIDAETDSERFHLAGR